MKNYHEFRNWENQMPTCEEFGFSAEDIPRIEAAIKNMDDLSGYILSFSVKSLRERQEKIRYKKLDVLEKIATWAFSVTVVVLGILKLMQYGIGAVVGGIILAAIPLIVILGGISSNIITPLFKCLEKAVNKKYNTLENEILSLENEEKINYKKRVHEENKFWYEKGFQLRKYQKALEYYNRCNSKKHLEYWERLQGGNGNDFENACADYLRDRGFYASVSRIGPDGGVDIIATQCGKRYACQCKALGNKVSSGEVQKLVGVIVLENFDGGFFFSLNGFSDNAKQIARKAPKEIHCISKVELME